ncbi:IS110 family transposase [Bacteroidia bacterium]|nr:IS110 family transposase [Bacteroidia bacterium]
MAKKAKKIKTSKGLKLEIVNPHAAGIDVSSTEMQVCVPEDRDADNNRRFGTFTEDLHSISVWLKACGITTVAMESTGVYWVQLFMILEADGFDVLLVNAKAIKNIGEKKTDEVDAEWIMLLHFYGLLRASFQPDNQARRIRNLSRHRDNLLKASSREVLHIQKAMELMNIKLTNVISDILGKSGQDIIKAILDGERDASCLASLADPRCKSPKAIIEKSLVANWDEDLVFMLEQSYNLYNFYQAQMQDCEKKIESIAKEYLVSIQAKEPEKDWLRSLKKKAQKNAVTIDIEKYAYELWGVNLMHIPGISDGALLRLTGELGHDFIDKFESYKAFCCWCNLTPNNKISGGKLLSSKIPKRKNPVGLILRSSANSLKSSKTPLGFYFRRIQSKNGYLAAIVATANKLARIIYVMVKTKKEFDESHTKKNEEDMLKKKLLAAQRALDTIQKQLNNAA